MANCVILEDEVLYRYAAFNFQKLVKIMAAKDRIDAAVAKLKRYEEAKMTIDIGGNWKVSVSSRIKAVDIRKWFTIDGISKPSRMGLALRLAEWEVFKRRVHTIHENRADIMAERPCTDGHVTARGEFDLLLYCCC